MVWDAVLSVFVAAIVGFDGSRELAELAESAPGADRVSSYHVQRLAISQRVQPDE